MSTVEKRFVPLLFPTVTNDQTTTFFIPGFSSNDSVPLIECLIVTFGFGFTAIGLTTCFYHRPFSSLAQSE
jgi:hypothetical protein